MRNNYPFKFAFYSLLIFDVLFLAFFAVSIYLVLANVVVYSGWFITLLIMSMSINFAVVVFLIILIIQKSKRTMK